jgi:hypothetical protein
VKLRAQLANFLVIGDEKSRHHHQNFFKSRARKSFVSHSDTETLCMVLVDDDDKENPSPSPRI